MGSEPGAVSDASGMPLWREFVRPVSFRIACEAKLGSTVLEWSGPGLLWMRAAVGARQKPRRATMRDERNQVPFDGRKPQMVKNVFSGDGGRRRTSDRRAGRLSRVERHEAGAVERRWL